MHAAAEVHPFFSESPNLLSDFIRFLTPKTILTKTKKVQPDGQSHIASRERLFETQEKKMREKKMKLRRFWVKEHSRSGSVLAEK